VEILLGLWADVARDLALVGSAGRSVHDTVLLDELSAISAAIPPGVGRRRSWPAAAIGGAAGRERLARARARCARPLLAVAQRGCLTAVRCSRARSARLDATVRGRVQGVGFRYFVLREAMDLGLDGWVANTRDGSVRCVAEGSAGSPRRPARAAPRRSARAIVDRVSEMWMPATGTLGPFEVRSGDHRGD
jgi:acylphosphatase